MGRARTRPQTTKDLPGTIAVEARIVGLRDFTTPSLEAVEHRRIQLWILTSIMLVSISVGIVVLSIWPSSHGSAIAFGPLRWGIVLMSMGFCVYAIDKERHLHKLSSSSRTNASSPPPSRTASTSSRSFCRPARR